MEPKTPSPAPSPSVGDLFLRAASGVFANLLSVEDLFQTIMDKVIEVTRATKGFLILVDGDRLDFRIARNMARGEIENPGNRISRKLIARAVEGRRSIRTGHAFEDPRMQDIESVHNLLLKSILCVPLKRDNGVFGVLYLENHITAGVFDDRIQEMVERVADAASQALGMTQVLEQLQGERDRLAEENRGLRESLSGDDLPVLVGRSRATAELMTRIRRVAEDRRTVLVRGESGTGKELVARLVHGLSPRCRKPLVAVNCAALPAPLFEGEVFGHARGAFTGADRARAGKVEAAEGGSLFLDEVGDLPMELQPKLLRLLEERTYERLGENQTRRADVRVIAATNKDLSELVTKERFRQDLYYRLNQLPILISPLRERTDDIDDLAQHFLANEGRSLAFSAEALELMRKYAWPGNVRSLRNVIGRAALYARDGDVIDADAIRANLDEPPPRLGTRDGQVSVDVAADVPYREAMTALEAAYLREVLARNPGASRNELAERLGMPVRSLYQRLRDLGLSGSE